jgi:hypothetical protein
MEEECASFHANHTWDLVQRPPQANVITGMWIFRHKFHADGSFGRYKARWVLRGFTSTFTLQYVLLVPLFLNIWHHYFFLYFYDLAPTFEVQLCYPYFWMLWFSLNYSHANAILPLANHKNSGKYTNVRGKIALACACLRAKSQSWENNDKITNTVQNRGMNTKALKNFHYLIIFLLFKYSCRTLHLVVLLIVIVIPYCFL